jgi:group I intron endonuclease
MKNNIGIYLISSPSGKIYIGKSININQRFYRYKKLHCKSQIKLYRSFLKHGIENHNFTVLLNCNKNDLDFFEIYYIKLFDSFKTGLNCTLGGDGATGRILSQESRLKLSNSLKGRKSWNEGLKMSEDHKIKLRNASTNKGKKNPAQSLRMKNKIAYNRKTVYQFDLNGNFIKHYFSANDAMQQTNIKHITSVCRNERKSAGGYIWKYEQAN